MTSPQHIPPTLSNATDSARGRYIPWFIVAFFLSFILLLSGFVWIAFQHKPSMVTDHAYNKGLVYNQTLDKDIQQEKLGWKAAISVEGQKLKCILTDMHANPVREARLQAWLIHPASQAMDQQFNLTEFSPGFYISEIPSLHGLWEVRITALKDGQQFQATQPISIR